MERIIDVVQSVEEDVDDEGVELDEEEVDQEGENETDDSSCEDLCVDGTDGS